MAKQGKNLLFSVALVAFVGFFLFRQTLRIDVGAPSISEIKPAGNGIRIDVKLPILNRSNFSYPVEGFLGTIFYGNTALGNVTLKAPVTIPAHGVATPVFSALISWTALATEVYDALNTAGVIPWLLSKIGLSTPPAGVSLTWKDFKIRGTLYVGNLSIDIDESLT